MRQEDEFWAQEMPYFSELVDLIQQQALKLDHCVFLKQ